MICVPSKDSDQPGHPPSLIRVFAVRLVGSWGPMFLQADSEDWSDWADAQADLSLLGAHVILLVLSWGGSFEVEAATAKWWEVVATYHSALGLFLTAVANAGWVVLSPATFEKKEDVYFWMVRLFLSEIFFHPTHLVDVTWFGWNI